MPRAVDHDERRAELARAVWTVAREDGVAALSVRRVAAAGGWSSGTVQYYFPTKVSLLQHAFELSKDRTLDRINDIVRDSRDDALRALRLSLRSLLPLNPAIAAECEIWFAFMGLALGEPGLRRTAVEAHGTVAAELVRLLCLAQEAGQVHPDHDPEVVVTELLALCDGLCVQELYRPWRLLPERMGRIVDSRLAALPLPPAEDRIFVDPGEIIASASDG
jgi:AcrR family transcriptional regulator